MSKKRKFYRATITSKDKAFRPSRYRSSLDVSKLVDDTDADLSSFQSEYADKLIWGVAQSDEVSGGYYSVIVAVSRFLAQYALDPEFRNAIQQDPGSVTVINAEYEVPEEDLFIFTEGDDKRLYPYKGNRDKIKKGHLIAQSIDPATESVSAVKFSSLGEVMRHLLDRNADSSMRLVDNLYITAGFDEDDIYDLTYETVLESDDPDEGRKWRTVIDSLNIAMQKCQEKIQRDGAEITPEQLVDVAARGLAQYLSLTRFAPELIPLDQYSFELRTTELPLLDINPSDEVSAQPETGVETESTLPRENQLREGIR